MARELELKFRATPEQLEAIFAKYSGFTQITMETVYFDTQARSLGAGKRTFRRRMENGRAVYTLKTPLPDGSRGEWETQAAGLDDALDILRQQSGDPLLTAVTADMLTPVCGARFTRRCCPVDIPGGKAELALDMGWLLGGGKEVPFAEAELELKTGSDEALLAFGRRFQASFALETEPLSKFARARQLAL